MDRIPATPPLIPTVKTDGARPLWSVMIPVYNCSSFLEEALHSVLQQDLGEEMMQIEVIDDASTDTDVKALVETISRGRVTYYRQPTNVGSLRNFETCINRSRGYLLHLLHGDDVLNDGYYKKVTMLYEAFPEAGAFFCRNAYIDEQGNVGSLEERLLKIDGILNNWLHTIAKSQRLQYVAITVKREVYEVLGSFYGVTYGEDWEMWARIAKHYPVAYTPEVLANYRLHFRSISGGAYRRGKNIKDLSKVAQIINADLKRIDQKQSLQIAKKNIAYNSVNFANYIWSKTRNRSLIFWQVVEILKLFRDWSILKKSLRLLFSTLGPKT